MQARSTILTNTQRPLLIFGFVPIFFVLVLVGSLLPFLLGLFLGQPVMGAFAFVISLTGLAIKFYTLSQRDIHFGSILRASVNFHGYDQKRTTRTLQAGAKKWK